MKPGDSQLTSKEVAAIGRMVDRFVGDLDLFRNLGESLGLLIETPSLKKLYHSSRWRIKDPAHLRDKLERKAREARIAGNEFEITEANVFDKINDLVGVRLLHLHTSQFHEIDGALRQLLNEYNYELREGPEAKTWDDEYRKYFESIGVKTVQSERMYTSVHYVVVANAKTLRTAEIQVRTLAEELWGEVDHTINYPHESNRLACREQIKVLARVTSSCTRLVDAIFATHRE